MAGKSLMKTRKLAEYMEVGCCPSDDAAGIPFNELQRASTGSVLGLQSVTATMVTILKDREGPQPLDHLFVKLRRKADDCCDDHPEPPKAWVESTKFQGNNYVVQVCATHPCGIQTLGVYFALVTYSIEVAPPPGWFLVKRELTPVNNSGGGQRYACPSDETTQCIEGTTPIARLDELELLRKRFVVVAVASSCCYTPDEGPEGLGYGFSTDRAIF